MSEYLVILVTCPTKRLARQLANMLLERHEAACVNILSGVESLFWWEGRIDQASETLLLVKTHRSRFERIRRTIRRWHPYDTPEIIALPITLAHRPYTNWILRSLTIANSGTRVPSRKTHEARASTEKRA